MNRRKVYQKLSALLTMAMIATSPGIPAMAAETSAVPEAITVETDRETEILTDEDYLVDPGTGFAYTADFDTAEIIGYFGDDPLVNPVIPDYVYDNNGNTYQVTIVTENAFKDNTKLVGCLEINSWVRISKNSFYGCTGLTGLYVGEGVYQETDGIIDQYAFEGCSGIKKVVSYYLSGIYINDMGSGKTWVDPDTGEEYGPHDKLKIGTAVWKDEVFDEYTVSFEMNGAAEIAPKTVKWMDMLAVPGTPKRDGYDFKGWFLDEQCTIQYSSATPVLSDRTLYAKWESRAGGEGRYLDKDTDYVFMVSLDNTAIIVGYAGDRKVDIDLGDLNIPGTVTERESGEVYTVTEIGTDAFNRDLRFRGTLTIPDSVTRIDDSAFTDCYNLKGALTIPDKVTWVGKNAFSGCAGLDGRLTIPDSVTRIDDQAFYGCYYLTGPLTIPDQVTYVGTSAFSSCCSLDGQLTIGKRVEEIGANAFSSCQKLNGDIIIPDSVKRIGADAFVKCEGFDGTVTFGKSLESIGDRAFSTLYLKGGLKFPGTLKSIGERAFYKCQKLDGELVLSRNLTYIGKEAFWYCRNLTGNIILISRAKELTVGANAFEHCDWLGPTLALDSYVDWNNDSSFFYQSFMYCGGLKRVINRTNKELYLPALKAEKANEGHTWKDASDPTGPYIFTITNGTAIRDDYDPSGDVADPWGQGDPSDDKPYYTITMKEGSEAFNPADDYLITQAQEGDTVGIQWAYFDDDKEFVRWETKNKGVRFADPNHWETTFVMPAEDVMISYVDKIKGSETGSCPPIVVKQKINLHDDEYFGGSFDKTDKWEVNPKNAGSVSKGVFTAKKAGEVKITRKVKVDGTYDEKNFVTRTITIFAPEYLQKNANGKPVKMVNVYRKNAEISPEDAISCGASGPAPSRYECSIKNNKKFDFDEQTGKVTAKESGSCRVTAYYGDVSRNYAAKYVYTVKATIPKIKNSVTVKSGKTKAVAISSVQKGITPKWKALDIDMDTGEVTDSTKIEIVKVNPKGTNCTIKGISAGKTYLVAYVDNVAYACIVNVE